MNALAQGMEGLALILSFALLSTRRPGLALCLFGIQGIAVSAAVAAQQALPAAALNAASTLAVAWLLRGWNLRLTATGQSWGVPAILAAAAVLSLLATAAGALALPLAILLLALLLVGIQPGPVLQALGLCGLQQAALLAAASSGGASPVLPLVVAVPVLPCLALAGLLLQADGARPS